MSVLDMKTSRKCGGAGVSNSQAADIHTIIHSRIAIKARTGKISYHHNSPHKSS